MLPKKAALEIVLREQLIFLDVMTPKISGLEVCRQVKQNPNYQGIDIILLTAKGQEYDREIGLKVGADCYITKPFPPARYCPENPSGFRSLASFPGS